MTAAVTDPYANSEEFRARVDKIGTADEVQITAVLVAVSRLIDRECGRFFGQDAAVVVRTYDGNGEDVLYVDDIATATGLVVKVDLNADYDFTDLGETLTEGTHFWVGPANAPLEPEAQPYRYLQVRPDNSVLGVWPEQLRSVQVTAKFGWPAVPGAIKEATIMVTREILDLEQAGFTAALQNIDATVNLSPVAFSIVSNIKRQYGRATLFA